MNKNPQHQYLTAREVSEMGIKAMQTLANDMFKGQGIPYVKFGRLVRYRLADVLAYAELHKVNPAG